MKTETIALGSLQGEVLEQVRFSLRAGGVAVFPTDTVYGLGTAAGSAAGLQRIYRLKGRPSDKPLPLLCSCAASALQLARFTPQALAVAEKFWPGAITLVLRTLPPGREYSLGSDTIGLRVPAHEKLRSFLEDLGEPLAATSANVSGAPSAVTAAEACAEFGSSVDYIFSGEAPGGGDSTVMDFTGPEPLVLREGGLSSELVLSYLKSISK
ncbi:MAG TPA: L-threonylcarbamoyladenylate synthase [Elusimicrobiales bacterium]|nr:L-threonylcarbamoyladenylate synthase [Elusimicrobiales bacterium]